MPEPPTTKKEVPFDMNGEIDIDDLLASLDAMPNSTPSTTRVVRPGDIDSVQIHFEKDEVDRLTAPDLDEAQAALLAVLSRHTKAIERLCNHFIPQDARYTLDPGSLEIEDCAIDENGVGVAMCIFTQSFFAGCRDKNGSDDCDCELDLALDRRTGTITVSTTVPDYHEREPDEF